jgi:lipopolysaccharide transport system ATP-binding protein
MSGEAPLITVDGLSKKFCTDLRTSLQYGVRDLASEVFGRERDHTLRPKEFWALQEVSFELRRGECLGLLGRNGAGKTTLLKMLNGLMKPDKGRITLHGRVGALIALGAGFNPVLTGRENVYVNAAVLGIPRSAVRERFDEIVAFAELEEFIDMPVKNYSSGMSVRLGFSVAAVLMEPDILFLDEVLAVGDAAFRAKCYRRISEVRRKAAVIFVSHNMEQVARICDRSLVMAKGQLLHLGSVEEGVELYERLNDQGLDSEASFLRVQHPILSWSLHLGAEVLRTWDSLNLNIEMSSSVKISKFTLRILFYSSAGSCVADGNVPLLNQSLEIAEGVTIWDLQIDSIPLKTGRYYMSFAIVDNFGELIVWSHKKHKITFFGSHPAAQSDVQIRVSKWLSKSCSHKIQSY